MKMFVSDNNSGAHPKILEAIYNCNYGHEPSYGNDKYSEKAMELFKNYLKRCRCIFRYSELLQISLD